MAAECAGARARAAARRRRAPGTRISPRRAAGESIRVPSAAPPPAAPVPPGSAHATPACGTWMKVRAHRAPARQVSPGRRPRQSGRRCTRRSPHALSARPILLPCAARHGTPATLAAFGRMGSRPLVHSRRHAATTIFQSGGIAPHRTSRFAECARSASRAPAHPTRRMRVRQRHAHRS
ncbi:hypothetical protein [Burkholderia pseudomallei]|uniref:hypothetical protein n=1 Tax=Burkholderia pseudomallei TaxID=28450 RepID=UPI000A7CD401